MCPLSSNIDYDMRLDSVRINTFLALIFTLLLITKNIISFVVFGENYYLLVSITHA